MVNMHVLFYKFRIYVIAVWNIQPVYMLKGFTVCGAQNHMIKKVF